ncbi:hypothetical protein P5G51_018090 [Virgibacillus sp. 179-BFC.A HS]|uniref:Uncharacterized protein n=1 Tax=Tigheibacillus jepli TaxID=3035914 RepID=A0ABU5CMH7_9BACI|nr:hypothetical protein [Virgibacillus sp. 179-BFC.A HS]MDY0406994.1 hypothetical protein [Virgibacillus sp. 179-BFC.A HS]
MLTNNNRNSTKGEIQELHAYTVDLKTEKVTNDQIILQAKESEGGYTSVGFVQQDLKQPIYPLVAYEVTTKLDARSEEKILETRLFAYHFNNEKAEEIRLPKKIKKGVEIETQNGNVVYFTKRSPEQLQVFAFDISNGELKENHFTMNNQGKETDQADSLFLKNNTLYLVDSLMDEQHQVRVRIFDAKTGEMQYKGVLKTDNGNGLTRDQTLTIDNIYTLTAK